MTEQTEQKTAQQSLLFVFRRPPYGSSRGNACMDLLLTAATFDQAVTAAFMGEGVFHLLDGQDGALIGLKDLARVFPALELYEVNDVVVEREALDERNLSARELVCPVRSIPAGELARMMETADQVFLF